MKQFCIMVFKSQKVYRPKIRKKYSPNTVLAGATKMPNESEQSPLLRGREQVGGKATAYVCENYACKLPVTTVAELAELFD